MCNILWNDLNFAENRLWGKRIVDWRKQEPWDTLYICDKTLCHLLFQPLSTCLCNLLKQSTSLKCMTGFSTFASSHYHGKKWSISGEYQMQNSSFNNNLKFLLTKLPQNPFPSFSWKLYVTTKLGWYSMTKSHGRTHNGLNLIPTRDINCTLSGNTPWCSALIIFSPSPKGDVKHEEKAKSILRNI